MLTFVFRILMAIGGGSYQQPREKLRPMVLGKVARNLVLGLGHRKTHTEIAPQCVSMMSNWVAAPGHIGPEPPYT